MKGKVFRSRISVLLIVFVLGILIPVSIPMFHHESYEGLYVLGGTFVFIILLLSGMRYVIAGDKLYLTMWFIPNGSADIADIVSVKRSYNLLSSPAGSLKRLCIRFRKGAKYSWPYWLISPVREREFIEDLQAVNPDIDAHIPDKKGWWRIWEWDI